MAKTPNRRAFTRVQVSLEAEVTPELYLPFSAQVVNASLQGVYLRCDSLLPIGTICEVELLLSNQPPSRRIAAKAQVVRSDEAGMGLKIIGVLEPESFDQLRELVRHNAADADQIRQEFHGYASLKR